MKASSTVRIGLIQMHCEKGAIQQNLESLSRYLSEAERRRIDIVGFPEANITGYNDRNKHPHAVVSLGGEEIASVLKMTEGKRFTVLVGIIEKNPAGKPFVTHIVARDGILVGYYRKRTIVDDDVDWLSAGSEIPVFSHNGIKFGISVCSDIDTEEIFAECARQGAQIVFELAAPGLYGEQASRNWCSGFEWWEGVCEKHLPGYAKKYGIWIAVATQAGRTADEDFPGGGYVFAPDGNRVYATLDWLPGATYIELDLNTYQVTEL
jgi:predicted amidohydrolase